MFNSSEKIPKNLLKRIEELDYDTTFKNSIKDFLNYIAKSDIYNASFVDNFDLYFGNSYDAEKLIFHFEIDKNEIGIYDENKMGDRCEIFFEFVDYTQELIYYFNNNIFHSKITGCAELNELIEGLKRMSNNTKLLSKYEVKKLITRQQRINLKIEEILSRKVRSI